MKPEEIKSVQQKQTSGNRCAKPFIFKGKRYEVGDLINDTSPSYLKMLKERGCINV